MTEKLHFSAEQSGEILRLHAVGMSGHAIADTLNLRDHKKVERHIYYHRMSPEMKKENRIRLNDRRRERRAADKATLVYIAADGVGTAGKRDTAAPRPAPELIADRDRRFSRPFDIRIDLLGEPEPGRSALDRKLAGLPA